MPFRFHAAEGDVYNISIISTYRKQLHLLGGIFAFTTYFSLVSSYNSDIWMQVKK
jgi:hypothetical protein